MKLSAFLLMLVTITSCAASQSAAPKTPWKISLDTSGGMAGRGAGNFSIDSDGNVAVTTMTRKRCTFKATDEELRHFTELLANAKPNTWKASYAPENRCCDRFEYALTIDEAGTVTKTEWIDDPLPMPKDLAGIADAMTRSATSLRAVYLPRCQ